MRKFICLLVLSFCAFYSNAQALVFSGATAHIGNGKIIENSMVAIQDGKIIYVGKNGDGSTFKDGQLIDVSGQHIYPGFIAPACYAGLNEIDAARPTRDYAEVGSYNPNVRSLIAYNTDSKILPTLRFNGVLTVQTVPQGGLISGSSSVMNTAGWNWEDAVLKEDDAIHLHWQEMHGIPNKKQVEDYDLFLRDVETFFAEAEAYNRLEKPNATNLKFEAMRKVITGQRKVFVYANTARGITQVIEFCRKHNIHPVIVGGSESYMVTELLKNNNVPIILMNIHRLPDKAADPIDLPYKLPGILKNAGIDFCIGIHGSWEVRNLAFHAGTAAAYGLSKEEALSSITLNTAKILGVDSICGSIETGKQATFFISKGDALDMAGNQLASIYIKGQLIPLKGMQQELFEKYDKKYFSR